MKSYLASEAVRLADTIRMPRGNGRAEETIKIVLKSKRGGLGTSPSLGTGPKGFEPLTYRLRADRSTWLSYGPASPCEERERHKGFGLGSELDARGSARTRRLGVHEPAHVEDQDPI